MSRRSGDLSAVAQSAEVEAAEVPPGCKKRRRRATTLLDPALFGVVAWIACGTCAALVVGIRNSHREAKRYQALIDALNRQR